MAWLISTNLKSEIPQRDDSELENVKLTARERRFIKFASVEFDDQLYMTPQDFLDSVDESTLNTYLQDSSPQISNLLIRLAYLAIEHCI